MCTAARRLSPHSAGMAPSAALPLPAVLCAAYLSAGAGDCSPLAYLSHLATAGSFARAAISASVPGVLAARKVPWFSAFCGAVAYAAEEDDNFPGIQDGREDWMDMW